MELALGTPVFRIRRKADGKYYVRGSILRWGTKGSLYTKNGLSAVLSNWREYERSWLKQEIGITKLDDVEVEVYELSHLMTGPAKSYLPKWRRDEE